MRFKAINLSDTFKMWRLILLAVLIGAPFFVAVYLSIEISNYFEDTYDPIMGYLWRDTAENARRLKIIIGLCAAYFLIMNGLVVFISLFSQWQRDASKKEPLF